MDDAELVLQVRQGNLGAYAELVSRYVAQVAALCRAHLPKRAPVDDLVQETFLRGLDQLADLKKPARFGPWLYAIARNLCIDWHRDPHHQHLLLDPATVPAADSVPAAEGDQTDRIEDLRDRIEDLKECIRLLPVELRTVIEIYYSGGRITYQDLADKLEVSFGQVNKWLTMARKALFLRGVER